jgi:AcrR family transcriptional regulator
MPRSRKDPKENPNYGKVLDAAARIFDEKGYHDATMQDIADAAGLAKGGLYHYLSSKAETLLAINERYLLAGLEQVKEIAETDLTPEEKLRALAIVVAAQHDTYNPDLRVALREFASSRGETHDKLLGLRNNYETLVRRVIVEMVGDQEMDPDLLVKFFFGSLNWMSIWYRPGRYSAAEVGTKFADLIVAAFTGGVGGGDRAISPRLT